MGTNEENLKFIKDAIQPFADANGLEVHGMVNDEKVVPKQKLAHAICCPFGEYIKQKEEWEKQHPDVTILEEVKSLSLVQNQSAPIIVRGQTLNAQPEIILMIAWAIVYIEN